jgi:methyl-accepting chemotaxis protein
VSSASHELEDAAKSITESIDNIVCMSEENNAGTEELAASAEEQAASVQQLELSVEGLAKLASDLDKSLEKFKI